MLEKHGGRELPGRRAKLAPQPTARIPRPSPWISFRARAAAGYISFYVLVARPPLFRITKARPVVGALGAGETSRQLATRGPRPRNQDGGAARRQRGPRYNRGRAAQEYQTNEDVLLHLYILKLKD